MSTYHWNAEDYETHSRAQQEWAKELIDKLHLQGTEDVLDVGCGDGKITAEIASLAAGGRVVGVDSSRSMIELARRRYPPSRHPNLSFEVMDASNLDFEESFDLAFSNAALHWIRNHEPVVKGLYRCLEPGGRILLQLGGKGNAAEILSVIDEIRGQAQWQRFFEDFDFPYGFLGKETYETLLADTGFRPIRIDLIPKDMKHTGKAGLEGWIRTTWLPYTERVPAQKREGFVEAVASRYLEKVPVDADGNVHVAMVRLEIDAERTA